MEPGIAVPLAPGVHRVAALDPRLGEFDVSLLKESTHAQG